MEGWLITGDATRTDIANILSAGQTSELALSLASIERRDRKRRKDNNDNNSREK